jgi:1-acyl-sn-glycerol-3-phosphate acyltransferase
MSYAILWLRSAIFNVLFFAVTAAMLLVTLPFLTIPTTRIALWVARTWSRTVFFLLRWVVGLKWEVRGKRELLRPGIIVASKHQSAWDTIVFFLLFDRPTYVMKQELMRIPVYGWLSYRQGHIPVDRKAGATAIRTLLRAAQAAFATGRAVVIFPQGTRVAPGSTLPYQPGIVGLYSALKVPVVPVALNSGLFWGRRSFIKYPGTVVIEILPEIPPGQDRTLFLQDLETRIETASSRLEAEGRAQFSSAKS